MNRNLACWAALIAALAFAGCGGDKVSELVDKAKAEASLGAEKVKDAVAETSEKVSAEVSETASAASAGAQEQLNLAGKMELAAGEPLTTSGCYAQFLRQSGGRPSVLQIRSYKQAEQESFPSVLIQAQTSAASASELVGQTLPAEMYLMRLADGPILCTPPGKFIQIKVTAVAGRTITAELAGGGLQSTGAAGETPVSGTLSGVVEP